MRRRAGPALALILLWAVGCVGQSQPDKVRYLLDLTPGEVLDPGDRGRVQVGRIRVHRPFERKGLVYRVSSDRFVSDFYHEFYSAPSELIRQGLQNWLERSGTFSAVLDPTAVQSPDWRIEGFVHLLYADFSQQDGQTAVMEAEFVVFDLQSVKLNVSFTKPYRAMVPLPDREPATVARGLRDAATQVFMAFDRDLRDALPPIEDVARIEEEELQ